MGKAELVGYIVEDSGLISGTQIRGSVDEWLDHG